MTTQDDQNEVDVELRELSALLWADLDQVSRVPEAESARPSGVVSSVGDSPSTSQQTDDLRAIARDLFN